MIYLHFKFENCGMLLPSKKSYPHITCVGMDSKMVKTNGGYDFDNPIPYTLFSNVLHVLAGEIPVPTKKEILRNVYLDRKLKRLPIFDEIAKNSYVRYYTDFRYKDGNKEFIYGENFHMNKFKYDSENLAKSYYRTVDGFKKAGGYHNWNLFRRSCADEQEYQDKLGFIKSVIGAEPLDFTFEEVVYELSKHWNEDISKAMDEYCESIGRKIVFNYSWDNVILGANKTGSSIHHKTRTYMPTVNGLGKIAYLNGEIISQIDMDEDTERMLVEKIMKGSGVARMLEGGIIYLVGIEKYEPVSNFKDKFNRIF